MIQRSSSGLIWEAGRGPIFQRDPPIVVAHQTGTPTWDIPFFRWYEDDAALGSATPILAENVVATVGPGQDLEFGTAYRLRWTFDETNLGDPGNQNYFLGYAAGGFNLPFDSLAGRPIELRDSVHLEFGDTVSTQLLSSPNGSFRNGRAYDAHDTDELETAFYSTNWTQDDFTEHVVVIAMTATSFAHGTEIEVTTQAASDPEQFMVVAVVNDPGGSAPLDHHTLPYLRF